FCLVKSTLVKNFILWCHRGRTEIAPRSFTLNRNPTSVQNVGRALVGAPEKKCLSVPTWWCTRESIPGRGLTSARNVIKPLAVPQTLSLTGKPTQKRKPFPVPHYVGRALAGSSTWRCTRESIPGRGLTSARNVIKPLSVPQTLSLTRKPTRKRKPFPVPHAGKVSVEVQLSCSIRESIWMRKTIVLPISGFPLSPHTRVTVEARGLSSILPNT
uniref:Uncharacterized protein n=1 Tax=Calidris pygmaea TaxID=425635 RepID=A0A8C3PHS3_9CHAR